MKKIYKQPEVLISQITLESTILVGSAIGDVMTFNPAISTDDQW